MKESACKWFVQNKLSIKIFVGIKGTEITDAKGDLDKSEYKKVGLLNKTRGMASRSRSVNLLEMRV